MEELEGEFSIDNIDFDKLREQAMADMDTQEPVADEVEVEATIPTEKLSVKDIIPVDTKRVYKEWLRGDKHSAFTGGEASITNKIGSDFYAWDKYIVGEITDLEENVKIEMSWRTDDFPVQHPNSLVEVLFKEVTGGTEITINHKGIPVGQGKDYEEGWVDNYFAPMKQYYNRFR